MNTQPPNDDRLIGAILSAAVILVGAWFAALAIVAAGLAAYSILA